MTYATWLELVLLVRLNNPQLRIGQVAFNLLHQERPDLAEQVRATTLDPFHIPDDQPSPERSEKFGRFLAFVGENW